MEGGCRETFLSIVPAFSQRIWGKPRNP